MRKTALIACASVVASALSAQTSSHTKFVTAAENGLRVVLLPPTPKLHEPLRYQLNEPAYVAAFIIYPGAGVRLIYPLVNAPERLQPAGYNTDPLIGLSFDNDAYNVILGPRYDGAAYLYVVASRNPINVARYVHSPMKLASAVGQANARSFYSDVAFDGLVNNAISLGDDASWDADVYTLWPRSETERRATDRSADRSTAAYRTIVCSNGSTQAVPLNYPFSGCPADVRVRPKPAAPKPAAQRTASASTAMPSGTASGLVVGANSPAPTVLPTIVGKRADADRGAAIAREAGSKPAMYTVANGDQEDQASQAARGPVQNVAPGVQMQILEARPHDRRDARDARDRDRMREDGRGPNQQAAAQARSPQLSPNPRLSPNPVLAPAPGVSSQAARSATPRHEQQQQRTRESLRVPPPAPPRAVPAPVRPQTGRDH